MLPVTDPSITGLMAIEGKLVKGVKMHDAEKAIEEELE